MSEREFWNRLFAHEDPWSYSSDYEQQKYRHTLEILPRQRIARALELGCAEGVFTEMLAPHVEELLAVDISERALLRARARCSALSNVRFAEHDIAKGVPEEGHDLVVCSEILYYLRDLAAVERFAGELSKAMNPGGWLLLTHPNMVSDDRTCTGFDFNEIGAKTIGQVLSTTPGLRFERELRTELYRVQLFRRELKEELRSDEVPALGEPREVLVRRHAEFVHASIKWGGCAVTYAEAKHKWVSPRVPILMYHRVAEDGPTELAPYRVAPLMFERQLAWLQRYGYHGLRLDEFFTLWFERGIRKVPGKPIVLTFDDAYLDFYEHAWPLLRRYGFPATVFVPTGYVGRAANWDREYGSPAPIMSADQLAQLHAAGVQLGSHSSCHRRLKELPEQKILADALRSREELCKITGVEPDAYCYPYASASGPARQIIRNAGFRYAVCGRGGSEPNLADPLYIPRIEVFGDDGIDDFIEKLPPIQPSSMEMRARYEELRTRRDRATYMNR